MLDRPTPRLALSRGVFRVGREIVASSIRRVFNGVKSPISEEAWHLASRGVPFRIAAARRVLCFAASSCACLGRTISEIGDFAPFRRLGDAKMATRASVEAERCGRHASSRRPDRMFHVKHPFLDPGFPYALLCGFACSESRPLPVPFPLHVALARPCLSPAPVSAPSANRPLLHLTVRMFHVKHSVEFLAFLARRPLAVRQFCRYAE